MSILRASFINRYQRLRMKDTKLYIIKNLLTSTVRAVRENIKPRSCCINLLIARWIQQDLVWYFPIHPSVSKLLLLTCSKFYSRANEVWDEGRKESGFVFQSWFNVKLWENFESKQARMQCILFTNDAIFLRRKQKLGKFLSKCLN